MRNSAILSSSSGLSTGSTTAFIGRTPIRRSVAGKPNIPASDLSGLLSYVLIGDARDLPLCRVSRCRSKGQSVMEPFVKAKRRVLLANGPREQGHHSVVVFRSRAGMFTRHFLHRG